jgi:hypothetical protein
MFIAERARLFLQLRQERHPADVAPNGAGERGPIASYKHFAPLGLEFPNPLSVAPPSPPSLKTAIKRADARSLSIKQFGLKNFLKP